MKNILLLLPFLLFTACHSSQKKAEVLNYKDLLKSSQPSDWRTPDPENLIYLEMTAGRVIIELSPAFAPKHAINIRSLIRNKYWKKLAILRSQENYVVQWGDAEERKPGEAPTITAEFEQPMQTVKDFTPLPDKDVYADQVGFAHGFPAGSANDSIWLLHCYGIVGAGRGSDINSGSGSSLYVVIGHAPRHLDRNITLVGRVIQGMEHLSTLPRGTGRLGFYKNKEQNIPIKSIHVASDVPVKDRTHLEILRTDTELFKKVIESKRNRRGGWFYRPAGQIDICNVPLPTRGKVKVP